jgi:hypothetical protein
VSARAGACRSVGFVRACVRACELECCVRACAVCVYALAEIGQG